MGLEAFVNVAASVGAGAIKGWSDEMGIDLGSMNYYLPIIGVFTWPTLNKLINSRTSFIGNTIGAALLTGVSYGLARGAAAIVKYHNN